MIRSAMRVLSLSLSLSLSLFLFRTVAFASQVSVCGAFPRGFCALYANNFRIEMSNTQCLSHALHVHLKNNNNITISIYKIGLKLQKRLEVRHRAYLNGVGLRDL